MARMRRAPKPIAKALAIPLRTGLLKRTRPTSPQTSLHAFGRQENLASAFAVETATHCASHLALLDDVMTTGATLHAAASALQRAGVMRIDAWICTRAP